MECLVTRDPERKVWMVHPVTGGRQVVTAGSLDGVWKSRGWLFERDVDPDAEREWALREARAEVEAADNRGKVG